MRVIALVSYTTDSVPYSTASQATRKLTLEMIPASSVPPTELVSMCGACMDSFSLVIGSSRCIECLNSNIVALLLAFAAAGVLLVFFILALDLTATQGLINGVIFYAKIVWAHKIILFPSDTGANYLFTFLHIFIAWLNLDFGIESCFFVGLDTYWKTWLQFLFPFYIWAIACVIIVACRYSSRLTNLIGSRAVPLLATLFHEAPSYCNRCHLSGSDSSVPTEYLLCCVVPRWKPTLLPAPSHLPFRSSHCYFYILVASLYTHAIISIKNVYKRLDVIVLESSTLLNLII